jgi:hypothetical protein
MSARPTTRRRSSTAEAAPFARAAALLLGVGLAAAPSHGQVVIVGQPEVRESGGGNGWPGSRRCEPKCRTCGGLDVRRVADVFQLGARDGGLNVSVTLPEWVTRRGGQHRVEVADLPGPTHATVASVPAFHRPGLPGAAPQPVGSRHVFAFVHAAMPDPDTLVTLRVQSTPDGCSVEQTTRSAGGHQVIRLVEQRDPDLAGSPDRPGGTVAQLWVVRYGDGNAPPVNVHRRAADFTALVRAHPEDVEAHVRPLLAGLGQDQAFAPPAGLVRQVLAEYWPADPVAARRMAAVLPGADHPDYRARERAVDQLTALGPAGAAAMLRLDRAGFSAARNLAIDRALAGLRAGPAGRGGPAPGRPRVPARLLVQRRRGRPGGGPAATPDGDGLDGPDVRRRRRVADRAVAVRVLRRSLSRPPRTSPGANR